VCVFDGTYYKITTTNYISKTSLYATFCMYPSRPWQLKILMFAHLDLHLEVFVPKKKKEIAAAGRWGSHRIPSAGLDG
jgi:hypothetical protein